LAAAKKQNYLRRYRVQHRQWLALLTGDEANVRALTDAIGSIISTILRPTIRARQRHHDSDSGGQVSKYFYGVEYCRAISVWISRGVAQ